ncbi:MAG: protein kinase, partial [Pseudomonadota bacterium]
EVYAVKEYLPEEFARRDRRGTVTSQRGHEEPYARGLRAFLTEANILKDLPRREGLVRVRGAFEKFGTAYCIMEFIEGDSLDRLASRMIARIGHVPQDLLKDLAVSILQALDALHRETIIHRDVKPANVMIRRSGAPVLIDFGAARRLSRYGEHETIFTRRYAAVEQFPSELLGFGRNFDEGPWSDLYSLAVVLYELIAHEPPPDAQVRASAKLAGRSDPYIPLADQIAGTARADLYDDDMLSMIDHGCRLMPQDRIRSARDFAERLRPGSWTLPTSDASPVLAVEDGANNGRRARALVLALIVAATTIGLFLISDARFRGEVF